MGVCLDAVAAFREALKVCTREQSPQNWASVQNNLGNALAGIGERETATTRLEEAVLAYRQALQVYSREETPLDWAMVRNNLAAALQRLGERCTGAAELEEAVAAYNDAVAVFVAGSAINLLEVCWDNRDRAVALIAERTE